MSNDQHSGDEREMIRSAVLALVADVANACAEAEGFRSYVASDWSVPLQRLAAGAIDRILAIVDVDAIRQKAQQDLIAEVMAAPPGEFAHLEAFKKAWRDSRPVRTFAENPNVCGMPGCGERFESGHRCAACNRADCPSKRPQTREQWIAFMEWKGGSAPTDEVS